MALVMERCTAASSAAGSTGLSGTPPRPAALRGHECLQHFYGAGRPAGGQGSVRDPVQRLREFVLTRQSPRPTTVCYLGRPTVASSVVRTPHRGNEGAGDPDGT